MKKIYFLLHSLVLFSLFTPYKSFAEETTGLYLKGATGLNYINPFRIRDNEQVGKIKASHTFPLIEVGLGYQFEDGIRLEAVFDYYFLFHSKECSKNIVTGDVFNIFSKNKVNALMLNGYKDIVTIKGFTPFIGGGIGVSTLNEKATGYVVTEEDQLHIPLESTKSNLVHRVSYKLTAGTHFKLADNVTMEVSYNYINLGRNKPRIIEGINNVQSRNYAVHNMLLGLRIKL